MSTDMEQWATLSGNTQLCRFLFASGGDTLRSNLADIFNRWLWPAYEDPPIPLEDWYRLCIDEFGLDVDIEDNDPCVWNSRNHNVFRFATSQCIPILLRNQILPYATKSEEKRYQLAVSVGLLGYERPDTLLQLAGLEKVTCELASFRCANGISASNVAASNLGLHIRKDVTSHHGDLQPGETCQQVRQQWAAFLIEMLRQKSFVSPHGRHLLFICLLKEAFSDLPEPTYRPAHGQILLECVQTWSSIVFRSGIDLATYGSQERHFWARDYGTGFDLCDLCVAMDPLFDGEPSRCNIDLRWRVRMPIYKLKWIPGAWPLSEYRPSLIVWEPSRDEEREGPWNLQKVKILESSTVVDAQTTSYDWNETPTEQLGRTQDDCGLIALRINKRKRVSGRQSRSSSQPPALYRRITAYEGWSNGGWSTVFTTTQRRWLPPFHLCPYDMSIHFDCFTERSRYYDGVKDFSLRDCCQGVSVLPSYVEDASEWKQYSQQRPVELNGFRFVI